MIDPTEDGLWRPLRLLLTRMDDDIARLYAGTDIRPTYVMELLRLHFRGPMTIRELAESVKRTHSALSQKVAAMKTVGLVEVTQGPDARSKLVSLTPAATAMVAKLAAEWRATEAASAELEAELPYPLSRVVADMEEALSRRSFHDRIAARLADDPAWQR
jgi:DNA-binding MarR family transcriptional regulator